MLIKPPWSSRAYIAILNRSQFQFSTNARTFARTVVEPAWLWLRCEIENGLRVVNWGYAALLHFIHLPGCGLWTPLKCVKIHVCLNIHEYREHMRKKEQLKVTTVLKSCQKPNNAMVPENFQQELQKASSFAAGLVSGNLSRGWICGLEVHLEYLTDF